MNNSKGKSTMVLELSPELLKTVDFEVWVNEDGDMNVSGKIIIEGALWTLEVDNPEQWDDPADPESGTAAYYKRLLLAGKFRCSRLPMTKRRSTNHIYLL